ncbi:MAG: type II toxin-antitoxin system YafQ family toxin [Bacteroidales bacterium]|nr:type II toxin-antitoxin system YafQ family toxin [Bacteroidales bacterium]
MRAIVLSGQYKKDLKRARKRNLPEAELNQVIFDLANDIPLSPDRKDHTLSESLAGFRECHIQPDWLLVYNKEDNGELHILNLIRTGTHSDLFKK